MNDVSSDKSLPGLRLKRLWAEGHATLNGWLAAPDPTVAENMAVLGWDSLTVDLQHGMADYGDALRMFIAISTTPVVPLARIPWMEHGIVMKLLDAGAAGLICPMVNCAEDAERFVRACRYPPTGIRSFGPIRAKLHAEDANPADFDAAVVTIAMIETREAVENLDAILAVEHLDAVYVGPADLSLAFGAEPKFDQEEPVVVEAIEHIVTVTRHAGKFVGVHNATAAYAKRMVALGANFVTIGSDLRFMTGAASEAIAEFRRKD